MNFGGAMGGGEKRPFLRHYLWHTSDITLRQILGSPLASPVTILRHYSIGVTLHHHLASFPSILGNSALCLL